MHHLRNMLEKEQDEEVQAAYSIELGALIHQIFKSAWPVIL